MKMTLPKIMPSRLQRVVADIEFGSEFSSFDSLCQAVSESQWAKSFDLSAAVVGALMIEHNTLTKVDKPESVELPVESESEIAEDKIVKTYDEGGKGKKQCLSCKKYVGVRTEVCACGAAFKSKDISSVSQTPEDKIVKTCDEGGKGKKQCLSCKKYVGVRTEVCACGATFESKTKTKNVVVKQDLKEDIDEVQPTFAVSESTNRHVRHVGRGLRIHTPSGSCPHRLTGTDIETVETWAEKLRQTFMDHNGSWLTVTALKFFAQEFYPVMNPTKVWIETGHAKSIQYKLVCDALDSIYPE